MFRDETYGVPDICCLVWRPLGVAQRSMRRRLCPSVMPSLGMSLLLSMVDAGRGEGQVAARGGWRRRRREEAEMQWVREYVYDVKQHESDRDFVFCFPPPPDPSGSTASPGGARGVRPAAAPSPAAIAPLLGLVAPTQPRMAATALKRLHDSSSGRRLTLPAGSHCSIGGWL